MKLLHVLQFILIIGYTSVFCGHLPEDKIDDGVELIREKRDNFIDRILKSIPFLHMSSPPNVLEEEQLDQLDDDDEEDDDDDDDEKRMMPTHSLPRHPSSTVGLSTIPAAVATGAKDSVNGRSTSTVLSATIPHTPTAFAIHSSVSVSMSPDLVSTPLTNDVTASTSAMIKTAPGQTSTFIPTHSSSDTTAKDAMLNISIFSNPLSASTVSTMRVSAVIPTSASKMAATPIISNDGSEPVIKMMIMSGESPMRVQEYGGRLADERGYGDNIEKQQIAEDIDVKNIRFMYASVLVPVMSGLVGALLITFGILVFKCMKRKKLKRVRYYGAKPGSGLYRLDQIGLLSDMSSDEE